MKKKSIGAAAASIALFFLVRAPIAPFALTATGCQCSERGTAVVLDAAVVARDPKFSVGGEACSPENVVCQHRERGTDRCDTYWIEPVRQGLCRVSVTFADGSGFDDTIDFDEDESYPCRGNVRPRRDGIVRLPGRE